MSVKVKSYLEAQYLQAHKKLNHSKVKWLRDSRMRRHFVNNFERQGQTAVHIIHVNRSPIAFHLPNIPVFMYLECQRWTFPNFPDFPQTILSTKITAPSIGNIWHYYRLQTAFISVSHINTPIFTWSIQELWKADWKSVNVFYVNKRNTKWNIKNVFFLLFWYYIHSSNNEYSPIANSSSELKVLPSGGYFQYSMFSWTSWTSGDIWRIIRTLQ